MSRVQWNLLSGEVASHVSEFWHAAELCFREYGSVMTDQIGSYDAGSAYSDAALEHPFEAYLNVAAGFHCEVIDLLHHRLGATSVDCGEVPLFKKVLGDLGGMILVYRG